MGNGKVTIATHNGSTAHRGHNVRDEAAVSKEKHIDLTRPHEIWHDEKPRDAYQRLFGEALQKYNAKQTRPERRILDYYSHVQNDAKKHPVYEMIIGVYGLPDGDGRTELQKGILREFVDGWKERNPSLELIGAYYHADEEGEPHVHIDYIPVARGYKNGMETQAGLVKALGQQGYTKNGKETAQIQWQRNENAVLDDICRSRGLEVSHPRIEDARHIDTQTYKAQMALYAAIQQCEAKSSENAALDAQIALKTAQIDEMKKSKAETEKAIGAAIRRLDRSTKAVNNAYVPGESSDDLLEERTYKPLKSGLFAAPETVLVAKDPEKVKTMIDHGMAAQLFTRELQNQYELKLKSKDREISRLKGELQKGARGRILQLAEDYQKGRLNEADLIKASGGLRNSLNLTRQDADDIRQLAKKQRQMHDKADNFDRIIKMADREPALCQVINRLFPPADQADKKQKRPNRGQVR